MKKVKQSKGITLVALIITIVVLLILTIVTIREITGHGIIAQARNAANKFEEASEKENNLLSILEGSISGDNPNSDGKTLASKVTPVNYGDKIEYVANGVEDWKIFYNNGTNVFIIASSYVQIPEDIATKAGLTVSDYNVWWGTSNTSSPDYQPISNREKFMANYKNYDEGFGVRCISTLLNTDTWAPYASGIEGAEAIGSPTLEMLVASYNAKSAVMKGKDYGIISYTSKTYGYKSSINGGAEDDYIYFGTDGMNDSLYTVQPISGTQEYWLASPSDFFLTFINTIQCSGKYTGGIGVNTYFLREGETKGGAALRPVVCLPTNAVAQKIDGVWKELK